MVSAQDVDRIFLQAVLSRGILSAELAKVLWEKSVSIVNSKKQCFFLVTLTLIKFACLASNDTLHIPFSNNADAWNSFVTKINKTLDKLDLEFRLLRDELSGREMYALVCSHPSFA